MADQFTSIREEINQERRRLDQMERRVEEMEDVLRGNKTYDRKGLVHDLAALQEFVKEIKEFKGKAVGISLFITAVVIPAGLWALKNMDFIQHLFTSK